MKQELKPNWHEDQRAAGERFRQAWDEFFSASEPGGASEQFSPGGAESAKIAEVRARREGELLRYPHVVGVTDGIRTRQGKPTGEHCLVVLVERKVPETELDRGDMLPREIDGVP